MKEKSFSAIDRLLCTLDEGLRTALGPAPKAERPSPGRDIPEAELSHSERLLSGQLMRVDHAGEVCAQALYQGQALTARLPNVKEKMQQAAQEENDHLAWTDTRLQELGTHKSYLNPVWYTGSFTIGAVAGIVGDKWSLGFVVETERQVIRHLESHLKEISPKDEKSRVILEKMRDDEAHHATTALNAGAASFPPPVKAVMRLMSKIMTRVSLHI